MTTQKGMKNVVPYSQQRVVEFCVMRMQILFPDPRPASQESRPWDEQKMQDDHTCNGLRLCIKALQKFRAHR